MPTHPAGGKPRLLHLVGSAVSEFYADLSRLYAADCLRSAADPDRYDSVIAYVSPDGTWSFPASLTPDDLAAAVRLSLPEAVAFISEIAIDAVIPQMFCLPGMTTYRSLFDALGIAYVGNPPEVMALSAHKARAKAVVAGAGVRVPNGRVIGPGPLPAGPSTLPVVVKPVDADNSAGITLVRLASEWEPAIKQARAHAADVLEERYVELGREVRCGIVDLDGALICLPLEEYAVDPVSKPVRSADDKLSRDAGPLRLVAKTVEHAWIVPDGDPATEAVWEAARRCYQALGCRDYGLFDFRIDPSGHVWFLEAGPYCSYAEQSVIAVMAKAAGITLPGLFAAGVSRAATRSV